METAFDLVVRGGTVIDGTGGAPFEADVGIRRGRIAAVGRIDGSAADEIDARHLLVTPGFVDIHTHYDGQATWSDRLTPSSLHGVTTAILGNCGVGFAPCRPDQHDLLIHLMEGVEDIPEIVMQEGIPWNWQSFPEYLDALAARHYDIDLAVQLGHAPLRVFVMGKRGADREPATAADLHEMTRLSQRALAAGDRNLHQPQPLPSHQRRAIGADHHRGRGGGAGAGQSAGARRTRRFSIAPGFSVEHGR